MLEKIKKIFSNKEKRVENLISFLIILVITLIVINKILKEDEKEIVDFENETNVELASNNEVISNDLEIRLENILRKIDGVGDVSVLITYSESNAIVPIYNFTTNKSVSEETDSNGGKRVTETEDSQKEVIKNDNSDIITEKVIMPQIEGAIITAKGANNSTVKSNIISAVEAVTGLATYKIQVFEMGDEWFWKLTKINLNRFFYLV